MYNKQDVIDGDAEVVEKNGVWMIDGKKNL